MTKTSPPGTMPLVRVLVVEDEAKLAELISKHARFAEPRGAGYRLRAA